MKQFIKSIPIQWRLLILVCLLIGITLRITNIENKSYWGDEIYTSLRVAGYTEGEVAKELSQAGVVSVDDLQKYQYPTNPEKNIIDTAKGLATEEPQWTPLYFMANRLWEQWFGNSSLASLRSLSIVGSLLALPCMWWLCLELFESPLAAWVGTAILAVSPVHVSHAQLARPYAWVTVLILLSSLSLLRVMRIKTKASWLIYAITLTIGFYTFMFTGLMAIAHAVYVIVMERFRLSKVTIAFLGILSLSILSFLPWVLILIMNASQISASTEWASEAQGGRYTLATFYKVWVTHLIVPFIDIMALNETSIAPSPIYKIFITLMSWMVRILGLYSFYVLCRETPQRVWLFIVTLTVIPALIITTPDLVLGGVRSTAVRYMFPVYFGFQLAITYLFTRRQPVVDHALAQWWSRLAPVATGAVLSVSIASSVVTNFSGSVAVCKEIPAFAQLINQAERPLVISDEFTNEILMLSHFLNPKVHLLVRPLCYIGGVCEVNRQFADAPYLPKIPDGFSDVFLYKLNPTRKWLSQFDQKKSYPVISSKHCSLKA